MAAFDVPVPAILRSVNRFAFAAAQDRNPVVAFLHINYAIGNLNLLFEAVGKGAVQAQSHADINRLHINMLKFQDQVQRKLFRMADCKCR